MDYEKMIQERQQLINTLLMRIQNLEAEKRKLEEEVLRLQGEIRVLIELMNKSKENRNGNDVIGSEDIK